MTRKENGTVDYAALAPKYSGMFQNIDRMQWEIGKSLFEDGIVSDGQRIRLAGEIGRSAKTLKTYYEVYVNFHERWPQGRPDVISHGVLEELNRLADEKLRDEFFKKYPKPTKAQAEVFVNQHTTRGAREPRGRDTTSITLGGVTFRISFDAEGSGEVKISGASKVGDVRQSDVMDDSWVIQYAP